MNFVYQFGNGQADGRADMKNLLGGKGANLAEMNLLGVPVPPGFTITTEICAEYNELGQKQTVALIKKEAELGIQNIEKIMGSGFGSVENPLLLSVRSGARVSMPGMMDTVLNLGLNDSSVEAIAKKSGDERFAWDSYRRFFQMYGDVVLCIKSKYKIDIYTFDAIIY
jgi:pyruvate,orthophosphate dikinase